MLTEPSDYEAERQMMLRLNPDNVYEQMRAFTSTARDPYGKGRHFRGKSNHRNVYIKLGAYDHPEVYYYDTTIVRFLPMGLRVGHGPWPTLTTLHNITDFTAPLVGIHLYRKNYQVKVWTDHYDTDIEWDKFRRGRVTVLESHVLKWTDKERIIYNKQLKQFWLRYDYPFEDDTLFPYKQLENTVLVKSFIHRFIHP